MDDELTLKIAREVPAGRDRAWQAWTQELGQWLWPASFETDVELPLSPGSEYRIAAQARELAVSGQVLEVDPPHRLVLSWQWDGEEDVTRVTVGLHEREGGTEVLLVHDDHVSQQQRTDHEDGWNSCLDRLEQHLA